MRTINNTTFTFIFSKDIYTLYSKSITDLEYKVYLIEKGKLDTVVQTGVLLASIPLIDRFINFLPLIDGRYKLTITGYPNSVFFTHSINKRNILIGLIKKGICPCKCKTPCTDCITQEMKECLRSQSLTTFINNYIYINKDFSITGFLPSGNLTTDFYKKVYNDLYFYLNTELCKQLLVTGLNGELKQNQHLYNYQIAIYYLGLYFEAKLEIDSLDTESLIYLDTVYDYKKIIECIKKLGICVEDMEDNFNIQTINVYYWQLGLLEDINDVILVLGLSYLNTKPFQTIETFEQGFDVPLTSVGKLAFAITNIDNSPFILYDSLGNDVTATFDTYYDAVIRTILFVSIPSYIPSTLFFKFKQV